MAEKDDYLLDLLVDLGFTSAEVVAKAREEANAAGVGAVDLLVANKVIRPGDVTQAKAAQFGAEVVHLANLKIDDEVIAMVATTAEHFGGVDILVNNAAITFVGDLDIPLKRYDLVMQVNLRAPLIALREVAPLMKERGGGAVVNVSSVAALYPHASLMAYGISKIGLERLTVDAALQLAPDSISVNCFRIDMGVASEGFVANAPGADHSTWEPSEVAAEGILWMIRQPVSYSGRRESMFALREREGIMPTRIATPTTEAPPTELYNGLVEGSETYFVEPYPDEHDGGA